MRWLPPLFMLATIPAWVAGQGDRPVWSDIRLEQVTLPANSHIVTEISPFRGLQLDTTRLKVVLAAAPLEGQPGHRPLLDLPLADGRMATFEIEESPVMEPELARRYPQLRTYKGRSRTAGVFSARFDWTEQGFHAGILTEKGKVYISPYATRQTTYYMAFDEHASTEDEAAAFQCAQEAPPVPERAQDIDNTLHFRDDQNALPLRVYRLALACTGEYARYHGGTVERVLSALVTMVNRLNQVFERDLAIRVVLVGRNDTLIFTDPAADPYTNGDVSRMLEENPVVLNQRIGFQQYDLGHVVGTRSADVGALGIASLGGVCSERKAMAASTMVNPAKDPFVIGIVAHEMGHQFNARHTFNNCQDETNHFTGFEPGGGTTIMGYGGGCSDPRLDFQPHRDDYYHVISLQEALNHTRQGDGSTCPTLQPTANRPPAVRIPISNGFYIPVSTPFELTAEGSDPDGDALTYCWEQFDLGPPSIPGMPQGNAPLFRSFPPSDNPTRVFPSQDKIARGISDRSEVLPTYSRELTFRCTVRDNNAAAGGTNWSELAFRSDSTAGPFRVRSPNGGGSRWKAGDYTEVRWDVANTDNSRVNCQYVNIRLSTDGGYTFPVTLLEMTPNDGSAFVSVPDSITNMARIRVEAADNIFFDISDQNFEIWPPSRPTFIAGVQPQTIQRHCLPSPVTFAVNLGSIMGYNKPLTLDLVGDLPPGATYSFSVNPVNPFTTQQSLLTIDLGSYLEDTFDLDVMLVTTDQDTAYRRLQFSTLSNDFSQFSLVTPGDGQRGIRVSTPFRWTAAADADSYAFELATSPAFGDSTLESATGLVDTFYQPDAILENNRLFFWRARPVNSCGSAPDPAVRVFQTTVNRCIRYASTNVPVNISGTGRPTVESTLFIDEQGIISDVNVPLIWANYQPVKSLRITLISPAGTEVILYNQNCGNTVNFRAGFDDEAPRTIDCPPDDQIVFRPVDALARFIGENTFGTWKLRISVVAPGFGASGAIDNWNLEFCADIVPNDPFLITQDTLVVPPGLDNLITRNQLEAGAEGSTAKDLIFLILELPSSGWLMLGGDRLATGDTFSQDDINRGRLKYYHDGSDGDYDAFRFLIKTVEGGLLPPQSFAISIDERATARGEPLPAAGLHLFPNPATDDLHVRFASAPTAALTIRLSTLQGQEIRRFQYDQPGRQIQLPTDGMADGIYFASFFSGTQMVTKKFVILR